MERINAHGQKYFPLKLSQTVLYFNVKVISLEAVSNPRFSIDHL